MSRLEKGLWVSQRIMGVVFLVAGLAKTWEPALFFREAVPYAQVLVGYEAEGIVATLALLLGPLECLVGLALLVDWKPRLILPVSTGMMTFFLLITAQAWMRGTGENCGCFGSLVDRSPVEAMVENFLMLGLLTFSWWGLRRRSMAPSAWSRRVIVVGGLVSLIVLGFRYVPQRHFMAGSDLQVGNDLKGLSLLDADIDLTEGAYLIELFSPKCRYCKEAVPKLNTWAADPAVPTLIALSRYPKDDPATQQFKTQFQPRFIIATISAADIKRLTRGRGYPRLAYIVDGVVVQVWERYAFPSLAELKRL
ncbi:MAG: hypothetical protein J4F35_07050 [Candidatus Latescibacteria bacterium]|nr:hypothetical protein [Candidatus Latescibacterota bacterium]